MRKQGPDEKGRPEGKRRTTPRHHDGSPPPSELFMDADTVRAMYRSIEEEDLGALSGLVDRDVDWIDPAVARLPFDGTRRGLPSLLRAAFRRGRDGTGPPISADTLVELGDGVLVAGRFLTDPEPEPFLHECLVRGGRIVCVRGYPV